MELSIDTISHLNFLSSIFNVNVGSISLNRMINNDSNYFDDLYPHLRHVQDINIAGADLIYLYLVRRQPRTIEQISERVGQPTKFVTVMLAKEPGRFICERGQWSVNLDYQAPLVTPEPVSLVERMTAFLAANGPSTAQQIVASVGGNINTVFSALNRARNIVVVDIVGQGRNRRKLWMVS